MEKPNKTQVVNTTFRVGLHACPASRVSKMMVLSRRLRGAGSNERKTGFMCLEPEIYIVCSKIYPILFGSNSRSGNPVSYRNHSPGKPGCLTSILPLSLQQKLGIVRFGYVT